MDDEHSKEAQLRATHCYLPSTSSTTHVFTECCSYYKRNLSKHFSISLSKTKASESRKNIKISNCEGMDVKCKLSLSINHTMKGKGMQTILPGRQGVLIRCQAAVSGTASFSKRPFSEEIYGTYLQQKCCLLMKEATSNTKK